jgi:glycyl-radical enzyme activating protein
MRGLVFNIQRFSVGDGPGIRTTVFLKGCCLSCAWCHNPESICQKQELQFFAERCNLCKGCIEVCPTGAHSMHEGIKKLNRTLCNMCGLCVENCMQGALALVAKEMDVDDVVSIVKKDTDYYKNTEGGLTISGGEPLLQKDFIKAIYQKTRALGIHNALDTAFNVEWDTISQVLPWVDLVLLDIKIMDSALHKQYTTVENDRILRNAERLKKEAVDFIIRVPVIGGVNDTEDNMNATALFLQDAPRLLYVELLPYHNMGVEKHDRLGKDTAQKQFSTPSKERLIELSQCFIKNGIKVRLE